MAELPDISDLITARENYKTIYDTLYQKVEEAAEKLRRCETEVVLRYQKANISVEECDHPVQKYLGLGESECACCGKPRP